jgi:DNA-binding Xre family transcriptional regulator
MKNQELRNILAERSIRYWELADAVGISPSLLSVWLRYELSGTRLNRVSAALGR